MTRILEFDDLEIPYIEIEVDYTYYYDSGKYDGKPEDCYPPEEEGEVFAVNENWQDGVKEHYERLCNSAILLIRKRIETTDPRDWYYEDKEKY